METLAGFPFLPALWLRRAKPGYANATSDMETLAGFPFLPALWLRRAKPGYANATSDMETLAGFPFLPALWLRRAKPGYANATRLARVDDEVVVAARRSFRVRVGVDFIGAENDEITGAEVVDLAAYPQVERLWDAWTGVFSFFHATLTSRTIPLAQAGRRDGPSAAPFKCASRCSRTFDIIKKESLSCAKLELPIVTKQGVLNPGLDHGSTPPLSNSGVPNAV
jgi:hypothetical protein